MSLIVITNILTKAVGLQVHLPLLITLIAFLPDLYGAPVLPTPEVLGQAYGLYGHDKDELLERLKTMSKHHIEWDSTYVLENAAGLASSCDMIDHDIYTYDWPHLQTPQVKSQLNHYTNGRKATGIFGFTHSSTLLTPWTEWRDLNIVVSQWEAAPDFAGEHRLIMNSEKIGCAVTPGCMKYGNYYTLLVCLLSPKIELVPSSREQELDDQPQVGLNALFDQESPMTPVQAQDKVPVKIPPEAAAVQPEEKETDMLPPSGEDLQIERQDYMPQKLYSVDMKSQPEEPKNTSMDYPSSRELEMDMQSGEKILNRL